MSILHRFFSRRSRPWAPPGAKQTCIIDASGFIEKRYREPGGQANPRDNFFVLKNLANFAQREELEIIAVFTGRPLREAGEGESFRGVTTHYAPDEKALLQKIGAIARRCPAKKKVLVVSDDRRLESDALKHGRPCLRLATLRKGMEGNSDYERARRPFPPRQPAETEPPAEAPAGPAAEEKADKNVLDLIDPI